MGKRGPVPKRSSERRRRNKSSRTTKAKPPGAVGAVKAPPVSGHWHPIAKAWFKSLKDSGQSQFFEPSDWQSARYVAEMMTRQLKGRPSAHMFAALWAAMTDLLTTEASRRRVRLEIERETGESETPAGVTALADYREKLGAS